MSVDKNQEIDQMIVGTLLETKAINFDALGKTIASVGPSSVAMLDDGWIRWCGNDLRIFRWPRGIELEDLVVLRDVLRDLQG